MVYQFISTFTTVSLETPTQPILVFTSLPNQQTDGRTDRHDKWTDRQETTEKQKDRQTLPVVISPSVSGQMSQWLSSLVNGF